MVLVLEGVPESLSLRDGRAPWPRGAMLTIGSQEETARVAMDERSRAVGLWGFAATLVFVVATGLLIGRPLF